MRYLARFLFVLLSVLALTSVSMGNGTIVGTQDHF
jgi:hypothetical protein